MHFFGRWLNISTFPSN